MSKIDRDRKHQRFKIGGILCTSVLAISIGYISFASNEIEGFGGGTLPYENLGYTPLSYSYNISHISSNNFALNSSENADLVVEAKLEAEQAINNAMTECADPNNPGGLGEVQKKEMENERKRDLATVDLDKIFQYGQKNGCFNALSDFPDLSVNIPTLTGIFDSVKNTLINYATRKACTVVDEALEGALGPIKDTMNDISDRGMLDLSGRINKEMLERMYEIDPEMGRISSSSKPKKEYDFKW